MRSQLRLAADYSLPFVREKAVKDEANLVSFAEFIGASRDP